MGTRAAPRILVTGYTGRLGGLVARTLRERHGISPRVLVRPARLEGDWHAPTDMEVVSGALEDSSSLDAALEGIDAVFLVSPVHPDMPARELNLARRAARAARPPRLVKISGLATRADSAVDSGRWHAAIEQGIRALDLRATFLRPYFFMQNLGFQAETIRTQGVLRGAIGDAAIAMIDARDIAEVAAVVLLGGSPIEGLGVAVTGARAWTYEAVASECSRAFGRPVRYERQTPDAVAAALGRAGQPAWHVALVRQFNEAFLEGAGSEPCDCVQRVLGREPRGLEAYLAELAGGAEILGEDPFPS